MYWKKPPVIAIVEWLSEPENYMTYTQRPGGQTMVQIQTEIANHVNDKLGTKHTAKSISSILQYMRGKYQEAKRLTKMAGCGHTGLREQILEHCPRFEELDKVFRASLVHNAPAPHQFPAPCIPREDDNNPSDLEMSGDSGKKSKCRREDLKAAEEIQRTSSGLQEHQDQTMATFDERRIREQNLTERERVILEREKYVFAREMAIVQREIDFVQKLKDMEEQHHRTLQEHSRTYQERRNDEEKSYREHCRERDAIVYSRYKRVMDELAYSRYKRLMDELQADMQEFEKAKERWNNGQNDNTNRIPYSPSSPSLPSSRKPEPSSRPHSLDDK